MNETRWILFDAVGTLIHPAEPIADVYGRIGRKHGSRTRSAQVARHFKSVFASVYESESENSPLGAAVSSEEIEAERWREIVSRLLPDCDDARSCFEELFAHYGDSEAWRLFPDVLPTLKNLREGGFRLAVASNFDRRLRTVWRGLASSDSVDEVFVSSELGVRKPHVEFYSRIAAALGEDPQSLLMVGDDFRNDVEAALDAGCAAVWLDRATTAPQAADIPSITTLSEFTDRIGP